MILEDEKISRRHALIQLQGEAEFWLVDLGSANGSRVNGRRIAQPVRLRQGDVIELSSVRMTFGSGTGGTPGSTRKHEMASTRVDLRPSDCWLMVADIIGSTQLAQTLSAEEFPRLTGGWFKRCREVTDECGGQVTKYLGDGFFCSWEAADGAALRVCEAMKRLSTLQDRRPHFRIVLHYGRAVRAGVPTLSEDNLHGSEVNFAYRMEKVAARLGEKVLFSEPATQRLNLRTHQVTESPVRGFDGLFRFFAPD